MTNKISVLNTETGQVGKYSARKFANKRLFPVDVFKQVDEGQKSYVPELYTSRSVDEYEMDHPETENDVDAYEVIDVENEEK